MAKYKAKGLIVKYGAASPPTTVIGQLGDSTIDLGAREGLQDVTTHDNTSGTNDKMDTGFKEPFKLSGQLIYDPADTVHEALRADQDSGATKNLLLILPDAGSAQFACAVRVASLGLPMPVKGKMALDFVLEGMGAYTFTA